MDNALRRKGLRGAKAIGFEQDRVVALVAQAIEQPEAGDAAAEYDDVQQWGAVILGLSRSLNGGGINLHLR